VTLSEARRMPAIPAPTEQTRARYPDASGFVERDGVRLAWERYGDGSPTILLLPTWSIMHSRHWKGQIPYLARHFRVVTFDGRGNGRSDRPQTSSAYDSHEFVEDAVAVLDATVTNRSIVAGFSMGSGYAVQLAAEHPERVSGALLIGSSIGFQPGEKDGPGASFEGPDPGDVDDWARYNAHAWRRDWPGFAAWFFHRVFNEPHSTKQIEDTVGWAIETDPETMIVAEYAPYLRPPVAWERRPADEPRSLSFLRRVECPVLVIHGQRDELTRLETARRLADELRAPIVELGGTGHCPLARQPVLINLLIARFARTIEGHRA
jgi:pimeloyl-ACP methyl ester carboxylesterase